tara:strand:- start:48752 stop:49936 length:1185 start_codon:yes stop_codon:yes gene_type:complete
MTSSNEFYSKLPVLDSFFDISDLDNYSKIPEDWYIGITDIVNSSLAIDNQKYKWVNILGASPIIGLMNEGDKPDLPFSFGGDGCTICFPPEYLDTITRVFKASKKIGITAYQMELRTSIIPVSFIRKNGFDIKVARFKASEFYSQAVFTGGGINFAEDILKSDNHIIFKVSDSLDKDSDVDFSGLECRWQEVKRKEMSVYSILIQANPTLKNQENIYDSILKKMREYFGFDNNTNPISVESLHMTLSPEKLSGEFRFRTIGMNWLHRIAYKIEVTVRTLLGMYFMKFNKETSETDWKLYKPDMVANNDHRKFDDMIRLVISCPDKEIEKFQDFLDGLYIQKKVAYGIHKSDSALITCMVFAWQKQHIHFVDGNNGGYVQASKPLKQRMKDILEN